jgi:hypothetical protein
MATAFRVPRNEIALCVNSEAIAERCNEALNFAGLIDNRHPARPRLMSLFPLPVAGHRTAKTRWPSSNAGVRTVVVPHLPHGGGEGWNSSGMTRLAP